MIHLLGIFFVAGGLLGATPAPVQTPPQLPGVTAPCCRVTQPPLRVFLDCNECDSDFVLTNVAFVSYVRDRAVADLHVLVTTESTGGGGRAWTLKFIGLGRFLGHDHEMTFSTAQTATDDDRRREFARMLRLGLVVYAADTSSNGGLDVTFAKPDEAAAAAAATDPWNYWVFRTEFSGNFNGEESTASHSLRLDTRASRTTANWKISLEMSTNVDKSRFTLDDNTTVTSSRNEWNLNGLAVKSLGPHWSFGIKSSLSHSSYSNDDRLVKVAPAVEFDVFPYTESTRRILTIQYSAGVTHHRYTDLTIFDKLSETLPEHALTASLSLRQPWGSITASSGVTQQMNQLSRYRLSLFGEADVRLFKGLSVGFFGGYDRIRNLIALRKDEASTEDILLRIQQLATGFSYFGGFNLSYSFGSIFNNVVNPRFNGGS